MVKTAERTKRSKEIISIPVKDIKPNPHQPRREFNWNDLEGLAESIYYNGLLQPITVRKTQSGYELVAGERRLKASKMAGLSTIPAIVVELDEERSALYAVLENLQREDLHFFDEALAVEKLILGFGMSREKVSKKLGISQSAISNKLRILRLPDEIRDTIIKNHLTERHARALLKLPSTALMCEVLNAVVKEELTVSDTELLVSRLLEHKDEQQKIPEPPKQKTVRVFKDVRLFVNTINHAVSTMRKSGIVAETTSNETNEYIEYVIKIKKP